MSEALSSSPYAWLRPHWRRLHEEQSFFPNLAPELQAEALARRVEQDHPATAHEIRDWNVATRRAIIAVLDQALREKRIAAELELWRMRKGERECRCVAVYLPDGIDMRVFEGDKMWCTQLVRLAPFAERISVEWATQLRTDGWSPVEY